MMIFSTLAAAQQAGFRWFTYSEADQLHIVETDRMLPGGRRVKALAFARRSDSDLT